MREVLNITRALGDQNRLRILRALDRRELCVCQITELLGLAMSTVSKHLSVLYQAGLVDGRKQGRWMYYSAARRNASTAILGALAWVAAALADDPGPNGDQARIRQIM